MRPFMTRDNQYHPGMSLSKIPIMGWGGVIFTLGIVILGLIGVPIARWLLVSSGIAGASSALGLAWWHRRHPVRPLSLR